jgi:TetR/AcrR family transcriptional repressor of nem operon
MCPCTVLGAASQDLPEPVAKEVKGFFKMCQDKLVAEGLSPSRAAEVLATITGALVVANALGDTAEYDRATRDLLHQRAAAPADRHGPRAPGTKRLAKVAASD